MTVWLCFPESTLMKIRSLDSADWERFEVILAELKKAPWLPGVDFTALGNDEYVTRFSLRHLIVWKINLPPQHRNRSCLEILNLNDVEGETEIDVEVQILFESDKRYRTLGGQQLNRTLGTQRQAGEI